MKIKTIAAVLAGCLVLLTVTGCAGSKNTDGIKSTDSSESGSALSDTSVSGEEPDLSIGTARVPDNIEDYAIFKYKADVPEGYDTVNDDDKGKCYMNSVSRITVMAQNYKEDYQALDVFAESACATFKVQRMLYHEDTTFSDPVKTTVAGFDAVYYDYEIISYEFVHDEDETTAAASEGAETEATTTKPGVKTEVGRYKGRIVYFYSDEDVFYTSFESAEADYDKNISNFEKFVKSITIEKK